MPRLRLILLAFTLSLPLAAAKKPVTVEAVVNAPPTRSAAVTWAPDGERFIVTDRGELSLYDVRSGKERSIIALEKLQNRRRPSPAAAGFRLDQSPRRRAGRPVVRRWQTAPRCGMRRPVHRRHR